MRIFRLLTLLLFFIIERADAQVLVRGPYLQMATSNSIVIRWRTDAASDSQVKYGTNKNNLNTAVNTAALVTDHILILTNLDPDTKYYYSIGTSLLTLQGDSQNYFRTAPVASAAYDKPVRFWAVGDMAKNTPNEAAMIAAFEKHTDTTHIDGFILLGDNAYNSGLDAEYQSGFFNFFQQSITKHIVLWPCLGNHDYANDYAKRINFQIPYFDIFSNPKNAEMGGIPSNNERYYSYNAGNVHFINLDSYGLENVNGSYYWLADTAFSPQVQWLRADLSANTLPWIIVSFHHPPYCMGTHNSDTENDLVALRTFLNPILEKYNVDLVLNGHCHTYQRSNFIRNHFGPEASFDSTLHLMQTSSGKYDGTPNSCLYVKGTGAQKDSGVVYMVVGSGSAIPQAPQLSWPHAAMQYSNYADNGSLYVTIEGNELNATWLSTDTSQVIKDHFTILKNVNKIKRVYCKYPSTVHLKAGWNRPAYSWSTGDISRSIYFPATHDTVLFVTDSWNCITDTFQILDSAALAGNSDFTKVEWKVYPNPASRELIMDLVPEIKYSYILRSADGSIVLKDSIYATHKTTYLKLPENLKPGSYVFTIQNDRKQLFTTKITLTE